MNDYDIERARRQQKAEAEAKALVEALTSFANGMTRERSEAFVQALGYEHPTLLGQVAKYVAEAVLLRGSDSGYCTIAPRNAPDIIHREHDGRLDCGTVIGAIFMSRQSLI